MDNIAKKLDEQIEKDLDELAKKKLGGDERKDVQEQIAELYSLRLEEKKLEHDRDAQVWGRKTKMILDGLGLAIPNGIALYSILKVMKFEETGFVKTFSARRILGWVKPTKFLKMFK